MKTTEPYFLTNEAWYTYDLNKGKYLLTDVGKALPEVVKSFDDFYSNPTDDEPELPPAKP